jgi:hypothetical protein
MFVKIGPSAKFGAFRQSCAAFLEWRGRKMLALARWCGPVSAPA